MLRKQLDELREEKSKVQMNNAKLAAKVCVCEGRHGGGWSLYKSADGR